MAIGWRIGPGGLFDQGRVNAAKARVETARLDDMRACDNIVRQVADAFERVHSLTDQIASTRGNLETAARALDLSQARKQFGVGAVLEVIQAQRDLTQARSDYVDALAESSKAQYALAWATGAQGLTANAPAFESLRAAEPRRHSRTSGCSDLETVTRGACARSRSREAPVPAGTCAGLDRSHSSEQG